MSFSAKEKVDGTKLVREAYDFKTSNENNKKEGIEISKVGRIEQKSGQLGMDRVEGHKHTIYHRVILRYPLFILGVPTHI